MLKAIGGRKVLLTYIILAVIVGTYWYMVFRNQVQAGDFSTFVTSIVALGGVYGSTNGLSKLADKPKAS